MTLPDHRYKVIGNVPYSITTEIVRRLVDDPNPPRDIWLVVQRELAWRLCGRPYTSEGLWSLRLKPYWHIEILDRLAPADFDPPPTVVSAFLWMSRRDRPLLSNPEAKLYDEILGHAFDNGATLRRALGPWVSKGQLRRLAADLNFETDNPASSLIFEQWLGILRFLQRSTGSVR